MRMNETVKISNFCRTYSGRSLLPARHMDLKVRVLNADYKEQTLRKGNSLGSVSAVSTMEAGVATANEKDDNGSSAVEKPDEMEVVNELMKSLQDELSGGQRDSVDRLIRMHKAIFSKHEYDIGRTPLVKYRIDPGDHRPTRQLLRRHPFQHLEAIDSWRKCTGTTSSSRRLVHGLPT